MNRTAIAWLSAIVLLPAMASAQLARISVTLDRGEDIGQSFGSLFEAKTTDGEFVIGAGFQNAYNTRYRADRHAIQFFIRPTSGDRDFQVKELPRPTDNLTGAYLFGRDGTVYSTYGGLKSWNSDLQSWKDARDVGGTHESMRVGNGVLTFGSSTVTFNGRTILEPPETGSYQLFFYANGYLCFYHVNRNGKPYHQYIDDEDGFSRLYACPWTPGKPAVDLSQAITLRLPVVGETTFAWGQLGDQIVTGSNIGGFYVFENDAWRMILEPDLTRSYQLYSSLAFHDRLLMGQYPTGRVFQFDGQQIRDQAGWPPVLPGASGSAREAQTTTIYGGDLFVGVWPWAEVWRYNPDGRQWSFMRRMFNHPDLSDRITHPYDIENENDNPRNKWGQRVTSLIPNGGELFVSTSSKGVYEWMPEKYPFLGPDKWKAYGKVYRVTMPGHLSASTKWTDGPTTLEFRISRTAMSISQDDRELARADLSGRLAERLSKAATLKLADIRSDGIYGEFGGLALEIKSD